MFVKSIPPTTWRRNRQVLIGAFWSSVFSLLCDPSSKAPNQARTRMDELERACVGQRCKLRVPDCPRSSEGAAGARPSAAPSQRTLHHHWGPSVLLLWVQFQDCHQEAVWQIA